MDCEYVLRVVRGLDEAKAEFHKFHSATPEEAEERATDEIRHLQTESVRDFPFAPIIVKGELYRQTKEIYGTDFIRTTDGRPYRSVAIRRRSRVPLNTDEALLCVQELGFPVELQAAFVIGGWRRTAANEEEFRQLFEEGQNASPVHEVKLIWMVK